MIGCLDVQYAESTANAACVLIRDWADAEPFRKESVTLSEIAPYQPGEFYRRELPCLLKVLAKVPEPIDHIVIDGYVWLGPDRPGLGWHLFEALKPQIPIIGVAKTRFLPAIDAVEILHGDSQSPLFISSIGVDLDQAAKWIQSMHGPFRIPTILKRVDQIARGIQFQSQD
jgi:deoxyribonuclease V